MAFFVFLIAALIFVFRVVHWIPICCRIFPLNPSGFLLLLLLLLFRNSLLNSSLCVRAADLLYLSSESSTEFLFAVGFLNWILRFPRFSTEFVPVCQSSRPTALVFRVVHWIPLCCRIPPLNPSFSRILYWIRPCVQSSQPAALVFRVIHWILSFFIRNSLLNSSLSSVAGLLYWNCHVFRVIHWIFFSLFFMFFVCLFVCFCFLFFLFFFTVHWFNLCAQNPLLNSFLSSGLWTSWCSVDLLFSE